MQQGQPALHRRRPDAEALPSFLGGPHAGASHVEDVRGVRWDMWCSPNAAAHAHDLPTGRASAPRHTIRGSRLWQQEGCKLLQNRDRTGAANIGLQFQLLVDGKPPLRAMSTEEVELHRHNLACVACDDC